MKINLKRYIGKNFYTNPEHVAFIVPNKKNIAIGQNEYTVIFSIDAIAKSKEGDITSMTFNFTTKDEQQARDLCADLGINETVEFDDVVEGGIIHG